MHPDRIGIYRNQHPDSIARHENAYTRYAQTMSSLSVLFVSGKPKYGSWQIRGEQIASTRSNWMARPSWETSDEDLDRFDVFCFVKVPDASLLKNVLLKGKLAVHDVVDWWRQPRDHRRVRNTREARELFLQRWRGLPTFHGHIFACRAMYDDLAPLSPFPTVIYHHHRPELVPRRVLRDVPKVGYEGKEDYLGKWKKAVAALCREHGMEFVAETVRSPDVNIGFAARDDRYGGYLPDNYKSNVKLANCYGAGIPAIMPAHQSSYRETGSDGVIWFETLADIDAALDRLKDPDTRDQMGRLNERAAAEFNLFRIASQYEEFFLRLRHSRESGLLNQPGVVEQTLSRD